MSNASTRTLPRAHGGNEHQRLLEPLHSNSDDDADDYVNKEPTRRPSLSYRSSEPRLSSDPTTPRRERPRSLILESAPSSSPPSYLFPYPTSPSSSAAARRKRSASRVSQLSTNSFGSDLESKDVERALRERLVESFVTLSLVPSSSSSSSSSAETDAKDKPFFVSPPHPASMDPSFEIDLRRFFSSSKGEDVDWKGAREERLRIQVWVKPGGGGGQCDRSHYDPRSSSSVKGKWKTPVEPGTDGFKVLIDWDVDLSGLKSLGSDVGIVDVDDVYESEHSFFQPSLFPHPMPPNTVVLQLSDGDYFSYIPNTPPYAQSGIGGAAFAGEEDDEEDEGNLSDPGMTRKRRAELVARERRRERRRIMQRSARETRMVWSESLETIVRCVCVCVCVRLDTSVPLTLPPGSDWR
jgi:hypothetical protein